MRCLLPSLLLSLIRCCGGVLLFALLVWSSPAAAQLAFGHSCTPGGGQGAGGGQGPDVTGNNFYCNGNTDTMTYPAYWFGSTTSGCGAGTAGLVQFTGSSLSPNNSFEFCSGSSWNALVLTGTGSIGIGTSTPAQALEVNGEVKVDTFASAAATPVCENGNVLSSCSSSLSGIGVALSALTSAQQASSEDNSGYAQTWTWNSLSTQTALTLSTSTAMTGGTLLNLKATAASSTSTGYVLSISDSTTGTGYGLYSTMTGQKNTGYAGYFTNTDTSGAANYGVYGTDASSSGYGGYFTNTSTGYALFANGTAIQNTGGGKLATSATSGFMNIAQSNGTPAGTPTIVTGSVPITVDNNGVLYAWSTSGSSWSQAGGAALSSITAATTGNTITGNANYAQIWEWNSLTTGTALTLSTTSMTTGALLSLQDTAAAGTSTGQVLSVSDTTTGPGYGVYSVMSGLGNTGYAGYFSNTTSTGAGYALYATTSTTGAGYAIYGTLPMAANTGYAGYFTNAGNGTAYGVYGTITGAANTGYAGYFTNTASSGINYGVFGGNASGSGYGGYFTNTNTNGYAGYFQGNVNTVGTVYIAYCATCGSLQNFTFGDTNIESDESYSNANYLQAQEATLSEGGTIESISIYIDVAAGQMILGVYDATGPSGGPGNLKAATASFTPTAGWNTVSVVTPVALTAGSYWLAFDTNNGSMINAYNDGTGSIVYYAYTYGALPSTFATSGLTSQTGYNSQYATVENDGAPYAIYAGSAAPNYFAGKVGIGTTAPTTALDVAGNLHLDQYNPTIFINDDDSNTGLQIEPDNGNGNYSGAISFLNGTGGVQASISGNNANQLTTANPWAHAGAGDFYIETNTGTIRMLAVNATDVALTAQGASGQTADLQDWENSSGTVLVKVTSSGSVGIGTTSPAAELAVAGHIDTHQTAPTVSSGCGGGTPTVTGTDTVMSLTWGSTAGTSCVIAFNTNWANAPVCISQLASTTTASYVSATTTSSITVTTGSNSKTVGMNVICQGRE